MQFTCEHCGRRLKVADGRAGKKGRCPQCRNTVTVPAAPVMEATAQTGSAATAASVAQPALYDPRLFDVPPAHAAPPPLSDEEAYKMLMAMQGMHATSRSEEPPKRPLPWLIDIFFYPLNKSGLVVLMLSVGVPFVLRFLTSLCYAAIPVFFPVLILCVLFLVTHWAVLVLFLMYVNWYAGECIRDSAAGGIRAADTTASTPGLGELIGQSFTVLVCVAACMIPAIVCAIRGLAGTPIFWVLFGLGGFLLPMALLAVTMSETLRALNPILLLSSALRTLVPYCALVVFSYALFLLLPVAFWYVATFWSLGYLLLLAATYQLLILAHLLGRFYYKNEEKLNWDT